ncbi:MAG: GntR family transcriptional regulator [Gammaproteobacteria bacterium]|nr:GntR family transcriptional regulator [Gammaproteobacteria bacterium]
MNTMNMITPRTQQERVYMQLRDAILSGQFVPGRSVTLRGVAAMLGVSPMPVREALRRLTAEPSSWISRRAPVVLVRQSWISYIEKRLKCDHFFILCWRLV